MDTLVVDALDEPLEEHPPLSRGRRALAVLVDVVTLLGSPWITAALSVPLLVVTAVWVIPLLVITIVATVVLWGARRQVNGDRLTAGQLVTGLTVARTSDTHHVVRAADAPAPLRPAKRRVIAGSVAFAFIALTAVGMWGSAGFVYYAVTNETQAQNNADAEWQAEEPQARAACDAFVSSLLSSDPRGGQRHVAGEAAKALPAYRQRIRREGVTAFRMNGFGQSEGIWEFMFDEVNPVQIGSNYVRSVSIVVQKLDGTFMVTNIAPSVGYSDPAFDPPATVTP